MPPKSKSVEFELFFMLRVHGKESDKTITVTDRRTPGGQELLPLFGAEGFHKLIHRSFTPKKTVKVRYTASKPTEHDCFEAARSALTGTGFSVSSQGIPSKWNPETRRWDPPPATAAGQNEVAYAFVTTKSTKAVESTINVDGKILFVDFVVQVQGQV